MKYIKLFENWDEDEDWLDKIGLVEHPTVEKGLDDAWFTNRADWIASPSHHAMPNILFAWPSDLTVSGPKSTKHQDWELIKTIICWKPGSREVILEFTYRPPVNEPGVSGTVQERWVRTSPLARDEYRLLMEAIGRFNKEVELGPAGLENQGEWKYSNFAKRPLV